MRSNSLFCNLFNNNKMKNLIIHIAFFCCFYGSCLAQYTPNFSVANKGIVRPATSMTSCKGVDNNHDPANCANYDVAGMNWSLTGTSTNPFWMDWASSALDERSYAHTLPGGIFRTKRTLGYICVTSPVIDISRAGNVTIDLAVLRSGASGGTNYGNSRDGVEFNYTLDGGTPVTSGRLTGTRGSTASQMWTVSGNTLQVSACMAQSGFTDEYDLTKFTVSGGTPLTCPPIATATQTMTWTGTVSNDWNNACNWSPNGVPTATNEVVIDNVTNDPVVLSGTVATCKKIYTNTDAILTINSGGSLNVNNTNSGGSGAGIAIAVYTNASIVNNGILTISSGGETGIDLQFPEASLTNSGTITMSNLVGQGIRLYDNNNLFTNTTTGIVTLQTNGVGIIFIPGYTGQNVNNQGVINYSGTSLATQIATNNTFNNSGTINVTNGSGIQTNGGTITNQACGKILMSAGTYNNSASGSTTTNNGLISIDNTLNNGTRTFNNNNVLKYGTLTGTISNNNGSVRVNNNPTNSTIFSYQGTFTGTINGIFSNANATISAGSFTTPNTFVPSGLPFGSQTLYARIMPSGGTCTYIVPFTYNNNNGVCTQVATATQQMTWTGTVSTDWANACNWSPNGVPTATNPVIIPNVANDPVVSGTAIAKNIDITGGNLTVNAGATLTVSADVLELQNGSTVVNRGTINTTQTGSSVGVFVNGGSTFDNYGALNISATQNMGLEVTGTFNNKTGSSTIINASRGITSNDLSTTVNEAGATMTITSTNSSILASNGTFINSGTIISNGNIEQYNSSSLLNNVCGKLIVTGDYFNSGTSSTTTNQGYIQISGTLHNSLGTFTNNGVLKFGALNASASFINSGNGAVHVRNNTTPIFAYGGTFNGTINGIFSDANATISAGTFTSPNTFVPSGLPFGSQTLYAKITPSGGACSYVVPFTYNNTTCSQVATATGDISWNGSVSTDWNNACNWTPNGVPGSGNYVYIANGATNPILSTTATVRSVQLNNSKQLTVSSTGRLNLIGDGGNVSGINFYESSSLQNDGSIYIEALDGSTLTYTDIFYGGNSNGCSLTNNGFIRVNSTASVIGLRTGNTITNNSCGKITLLGGGDFNNPGVVTNYGLIETANNISQSGTFTNNGVLKYGTLTGTITNTQNSSVIVKNTPTPIFTYGGTYNGTINGIFSNAAATTSAGTFTAPNTFTPLGTLPTGSQTLYAKITPSGGACTYIVPFTFTPPTLTVGAATNPTTCGGTGSIAFTTTNVPNGTYALSFTTTGTSSPQNVTVANNAFTLGSLAAGNYSNFSLSVSGTPAAASTAKTITPPSVPTLTAGTITNPTTCGGTGSIAFTSTNLPNGTYALSFTASSGATTSPQNVTVSGNAFNLTGLKAGTYSNFSLTTPANCTGSVATSKVLTDPSVPTLTAGIITHPTTCSGTNGSIAFSTNLANGTYTLNYSKNGIGTTASVTVASSAFTLSNLGAGTYTPFSITNAGCIGSVATSKVLNDPSVPTLTAGTAVNPTTCGGTNGRIPFTTTNLPSGNYTLNYSKNGTATTASITVASNAFTLTGLTAGTYTPFSITRTGCVGTTSTSKVLNDPTTPTITAGTVINPTTCGGTGSIPFTTTNLANGTYELTFTATGTDATTSPQNVTVSSNAFTLSGLAVGTYSNFSLTRTGCTATDAASKSIANPPLPTLAAGVKVNPTSCGGTNGSIPFTTNLPNGTYALTYTGAGSPKNVTVNNGAFTLSGLAAGGYSNFSVTHNGCTRTITAARSLSDPNPPVLTLGATSNPTACNLSNGTIAFTATNITNGTYTLSYSLNGATTSKSVTVATNAFTLSGLADGTYGDFSITNTVGCTGALDADVTLSDLALPVLTFVSTSNPTTCLGTEGGISFTSANLPDATYSLSFNKNGTATSKNVMVASNAFTLSGLTAGVYNNFSVTRLGCTGSLAISKTLTDPSVPSLTIGVKTNPTTCAGTDGEIEFTSTNLPNGTYALSFTTTGTTSPKNVTVTNNAFTLEGLKAGDYSAFSITRAGCTGSAATLQRLSDPASPIITAGTPVQPTTCSTADGSIPFTSTNLPNGDYTLTYTGAGSPKTVTVAANAFSLTGLDNGTYSNFSLTHLGCTATNNVSKTVTNPAAPTLTAGTATNPTTCASADGTIPFTTTLPNGTYSLVYTGAGSPKSVTVASGAFTLTGLNDGSYSNFRITHAGCTSQHAGSKTLTDPASPTLTAGTPINPTTCGGTGSIPFTTSLPNGTYALNYTGSGSPQNVTVASGAFTLGNLPQGTYSGFSVTTGGCTGIDNTTKTLTDPSVPTLTAGTAVNPTTCGGTNGSIPFTTNLPNGSYSISYTGAGSPRDVTVSAGTFTLSGLAAGTYSSFSITTGGCTGSDATSKTLNDPSAPTLAAGTAVNPTTCGGTNGSIPFTTNLPNGTYSLNYAGAGSPKNVSVNNGVFTLSGLAAGSYSGFSITNAGCTGSDATSKTLTDPSAPTLAAGTAVNPTTCGGTNGSIPFTTNLPNGSYSLSYTGAGSPKNVSVNNGVFTLSGLAAGSYSGFSVTTGGCTGSDATTKTLNDPSAPTLAAGTAVNPTTCGGTGSIPFTTTNLANATYSLSFTATGANATTSPQNVTIASNAFTLSSLGVGTYSNFSLTRTGCTATDATSKSIANPPLPTLAAGTQVNPTFCGGNDGSIPFTTNLPNGTYSLSYTGAGSPKNVTVSSGTFTLSGLAAGGYSNFSVTHNGCTRTIVAARSLSDPNPPVLTLGTPSNPTACNLSDGMIRFTATNFATSGSYPLTYSFNGVLTSKNVTVNSSGTFTLTGLADGTYGDFSITNTAGCTGALETDVTLSDLALPVLTVGTATNPTTCLGTEGGISFTSANLPDGTYPLSFNKNGTATSKNVMVAANAFTLDGLSAGTYDNFSVTRLGCTGSLAISKTLNDPSVPSLTVGVKTDPTSCAGTDGEIDFTTTNLSNGTYALSFTSTGTTSPQNVLVTNNAFTLTGLKAGTYSAFSITRAGCTGTDATSKTLNDPSAPTLAAGTAVNPTTCGGTNGSIPFTTNLPNGTYSLSYTGAGSPKSITVSNGVFTLSGLAAGSYSGFSVTNAGCTGSDATSKTLNDPSAPTLAAGTAVNPTTCGGTNGSIPFTTNLPNGTYSLSYTGAGSPKSIIVASGAFTLSGLAAGSYSGFSVTNAGCTGSDATSKTLNDPSAPTLAAGTPVNPTTCGGTNGSIPFTTNLPNGTYSLSYTGAGSPKSITVSNGVFTLSGLAAGTYSSFSITTGGCTGSDATSKTLNDPSAPTLAAGTAVNPTTCGGTNGSIPFTTNLPNGTYSLNYTGAGSPKNVSVNNGVFTLSGLAAGSYSGFSLTNAGCTGSDATTKTLNDPTAPTLAAGQATNTTSFGGTDGSIAFTTSLPNGTYALNYTVGGNPQTASVTVTNGAFTLSNLAKGTYTGFSVTKDNCAGVDNTSKVVSDPAAPTLSYVTSGNPTMCGIAGTFFFNSTNLPAGAYSMSFTASGTGASTSPQNVTVRANGSVDLLVKAGTYSNFTINYLGYAATSTGSRTLNDPASPIIVAGMATNPTTCAGTDGSIPFTTTHLSNNTYTLNYSKNGTPTTASVTVANSAFTLSGLTAGSYTGFSITSSGCTGSDATTKTLNDPPAPNLVAGTVTHPTTCSGTNGSIAFTSTNVPNNTYTLNYSKNGTATSATVTVANNAFVLGNLTAGSYSQFSITNAGCTSALTTTIGLTDPATPTLAAGNVTNPTTCGGTNGSIAFTSTNLLNGNFTLNYRKNGTATSSNVVVTNNAFTLMGLTAGSYSQFSITQAGCTGSDATTKALSDPTPPTLMASTVMNPTTCGGINGSIAFTSTNLSNGTYRLSFSRNGIAMTADVAVMNDAFVLNSLRFGTYTAFSITNQGCTGALATAISLTEPTAPVLTVGEAMNPTLCGGRDGSIAFTSLNLPNGTYELSYSTMGFGTRSPQSVTVSDNVFALKGLTDGTYSNFSITRLGCTGTVATSKTLLPPPNPVLSVVGKTNPTICGGSDGSIAFSTTHLPNGAYGVLFKLAGIERTKNVRVQNNAFVLEGLQAGDYTDFSMTYVGCTGVLSTVTSLIDPNKPTISARTVTAPTTCTAADGQIAFTTTNLSDGNYTINYTGDGSPKTVRIAANAFSLTGLSNGFYSNFSIINGGCTATEGGVQSVINAAVPTLTASGRNPITVCEGVNSDITFRTTNLPNGTYPLSFTGAGTGATASPHNVVISNNAFVLAGMKAGTYSQFAITSANGCNGMSGSSVVIKPSTPVQIMSLPAYLCKTATPIVLTANVMGGVFQVDGVNATRIDPSVLNSGNHQVTYNFTNAAGCTTSDAVTVQTGALGSLIPDARFAAAIRSACPTCIDDCNYLMPPAARLEFLNVSGKNITDMTGIEHFTSLQNLYCFNNRLSSLPANLPNSLVSLYCYDNQLTQLPNTLPQNLMVLLCNNNLLTTLPNNLPNTIVELRVANNFLRGLPTLPFRLDYLECHNNNINCIPALPALRTLRLDADKIRCLPSTPRLVLDAQSQRVILPICINPCQGESNLSIQNAPKTASVLRGVKIYPNPVHEVLTIDNAEGQTIEIVNALGQVVIKQASSDIQTTIRVSTLEKGVYVVRIADKSFKILKQ
jgi:Secretion system C-terminal sorting domain